jgi:pimeloyl-ACP methyl ester carboxylesterase
MVKTTTVAGSGGLSIAVFEQGPAGAPTIVLVHGYPDDHHVWDLVVPNLANDFHVVTYDVRGFGESAVPTERAGYRVEHLVADFVAVAEAVSPDGPVHLVGHDWGSIQCWPMVNDPAAATRIASFTSLSGPSLDHVRPWISRHLQPGGGRWRALARQGARSWYTQVFRTPLASHAWTSGRAEALFRTVLQRREGAVLDDNWPGPHARKNGLNGLELYRANLAVYESDRSVVPTTVPVQLLVSRGDPYVTPALLDGIEDLAPDLVRRDVAGLHWLPRTRAADMAGWIREQVEAVETDERLTAPSDAALVSA